MGRRRKSSILLEHYQNVDCKYLSKNDLKKSRSNYRAQLLEKNSREDAFTISVLDLIILYI